MTRPASNDGHCAHILQITKPGDAMRHTLFALFESATEADAALTELQRLGAPDARCDVVVHRGHLHDADVTPGESRARTGVLLGAVLGGALGALAGAVTLYSTGLGLPGALLLGGAGLALGGAFGGMGGSASPDPSVERMVPELDRGGVLLTVRAPDDTSGELAERLLAERGARVEHRSLL